MSEPTEEQIRAFEEQLKHIHVEDVIVQTLVTLVNLAARRLGLTGDPESRDLDQARLAIEAARALMPLVPADDLGPIREALSQLQMAFARETQTPPGQPAAAGASESSPEGPNQGATGDAPAAAAGDAEAAAERAKARQKIWTPPGT